MPIKLGMTRVLKLCKECNCIQYNIRSGSGGVLVDTHFSNCSILKEKEKEIQCWTITKTTLNQQVQLDIEEANLYIKHRRINIKYHTAEIDKIKLKIKGFLGVIKDFGIKEIGIDEVYECRWDCKLRWLNAA